MTCSYNADIIDSNYIAEKVLFLDNITISYRNTNEVSSIIVWAIGGPPLFLRWYEVTMEKSDMMNKCSSVHFNVTALVHDSLFC